MTSGRRILSRNPFNSETDSAAFSSDLTPERDLFVRNHGAPPVAARGAWRLQVTTGARSKAWTLDALRALPARSVTMVLECAGNGRSRFSPPASGLPWGEDAVGNVRFRGPSVKDVLGPLGRDVKELLFAAPDADENGVAFERSLPRAKALHADTILAYELNERPLSHAHGGPVRVVAPGWYGVASVKWLDRIETRTDPFDGKYQTESYVYRNGGRARPVAEVRIKSRILSPPLGAQVRKGRPVRVMGRAWGGAGVARVEVSDDDGRTWSRARLGRSSGKHAWREWKATWTPRRAGEAVLLSRATDVDGATQSVAAPWNELGYGNNAIIAHTITAAAPARHNGKASPRSKPSMFPSRTRNTGRAR